MTVPEWFKKELALIDPLLFAWWNPMYDYWEIKVDTTDIAGRKIEINPEKQVQIRNKYPTIDVAHVLDQRVLHDLRKRRFDRLADPSRDGSGFLKFIRERQKEAREKKRKLAMEMIAEGLVKMDRAENTKTFIMGGT